MARYEFGTRERPIGVLVWEGIDGAPMPQSLADRLTVRFREVNGIPFERIRIDPRALVIAGDSYAQATGECDEIALGRAIEDYLEAAES